MEMEMDHALIRSLCAACLVFLYTPFASLLALSLALSLIDVLIEFRKYFHPASTHGVLEPGEEGEFSSKNRLFQSKKSEKEKNLFLATALELLFRSYAMDA